MEDRTHLLREYWVEYRQYFDDGEADTNTMSFQAEDSDHAIEQAEDALQSDGVEFELLGVGVN